MAASVETLARLMRRLEDQLVVCMRCGMCQAVCPVFGETGREADVARGKLALLDGLMRRLLRDPGGVRRRLEMCLLCGSCAANCPSGVSAVEIFLEARVILTGYLGLSPARRPFSGVAVGIDVGVGTQPAGERPDPDADSDPGATRRHSSLTGNRCGHRGALTSRRASSMAG